MFGNPINYGANTLNNQGDVTLMQALGNMIPQVAQEICTQNGLDANVYNSLVTAMQQQAQSFAQSLPQGDIHSGEVYKSLRNFAVTILNENNVKRNLFSNQNAGMGCGMGGGMGGMGGMGGGVFGMAPQSANVFGANNNAGLTSGNAFGTMGTTGVSTTTSLTDNQPAPQAVIQPKPDAPKPMEAPAIGAMRQSTLPITDFTRIDTEDLTKYDKGNKRYGILDVNRMSKYQDRQSNSVTNYSQVRDGIREISVRSALHNIKETNPLLFKGNWACCISTEIFSISQPGTSHTDSIDVSYLNSDDPEVGVELRISSVIKSIQKKNHNFVRMFSELFLMRFNDYLNRYVRLSNNPIVVSADSLDAVVELATPSSEDAEVKELIHHPKYLPTLLKCFNRAFASMVSVDNPAGYEDVSGVIFDLKAHPDFIIRESHFCERDPEIDTDDKLLSYVKKNFTVMSQSHLIVYMNSIPGDLYDALYSNEIVVDEIRTIVDELVLSHLVNDEPVFVCEENDSKIITFGSGLTMDNVRFLYLIDRV